MPTHTPGPWTILWERDGGTHPDWGMPLILAGESPDPADPDVVADLNRTRDDGPPNEMDRADAHLIAAAPDLLAACEAAIEALPDTSGTYGRVRASLRAAVAKARGGGA